ncbi:MAG: site-2 protease family protein [Candidatus Riflebacteria bacterium]|nr:site-2 protease family protein [Candidatus Riflebacteria bacterium]
MISWLTVAGWLKAILGFGLLIVVHEAGHLLALKWRGYPVFAFSVGFGKPLLRRRWRGTEYRVGWLPLGGYVLPENPDQAGRVDPAVGDDPTREQPPADQFLVALAGPLANFVLAWVVFFVLIGMVGMPQPVPIVESVLKQGPCAEAGIRHGDRLLAMNGVAVRTWDEFVRLIQVNGPRPGTLTIDRSGDRIDLAVTPREEGPRCIVGIVPAQAPATRPGWGMAAGLAVSRTWTEIQQVTVGLFGLVLRAGGGEVSGPLAIIDHISQAAGSWLSFLTLLAVLSVNLGVFNLLPLPPLDGVRLVLAVVQACRRRPLEERILLPIYQWGTAGLALLFLLVTIKDLRGFLF